MNQDIDLHPRGLPVGTFVSDMYRVNADVIELCEKLASENEKLARENKKATDELELYKSFYQIRGTRPGNDNEPVNPQEADRVMMKQNEKITALILKITDTELEKRRFEQEIDRLQGTIVGLEQEIVQMNGSMEEERKFIDLRKKYIEVNIRARDLENQKKIEETKQSIAERLRMLNVNKSGVTAAQNVNNSVVTPTPPTPTPPTPSHSHFHPSHHSHSSHHCNPSHSHSHPKNWKI